MRITGYELRMVGSERGVTSGELWIIARRNLEPGS